MLVEQLSLGGITLHYLTGLHGRRCRTGTPQRAPGVQKWAAGGCTCTQYSTSTAYGGANGRLCDCSGCWFITLARSRPILLIIIFVKLIISVSVSVTVPMNYTRITLINQQNGFWGKCFVHMDVLPFRERLMSSPFISVLTSVISHRRIVLRRALRLSCLYPQRGSYLLSLKAKQSVYSGGGGELHMARIEWYSIHTFLLISYSVIYFLSSSLSPSAWLDSVIFTRHILKDEMLRHSLYL